MIRWLLYPLTIFCLVSLLVNLLMQDWADCGILSAVLAVVILAIILTELRHVKHREQWIAEMESLRGIDKCPISNDQLCDLFTFLDRPNSPACKSRLHESYGFLQDRGLEIELTLRWLTANGAKCDCEVIHNTSQRFGPDVGFEPADETNSLGESIT